MKIESSTRTKYPVPRDYNGFAISSLTLGVLSLILIGGMLIGAVLAIVLGHIARREIAQSTEDEAGSGMATAGIILGWVGVAEFAVYAVIVSLALTHHLH